MPATCVIGEIGLGGEVRQVAHARRRLGEAARIGFRRAIVPGVVAAVRRHRLVRVRTVAEALAAVGIGRRAAVGAPRRPAP